MTLHNTDKLAELVERLNAKACLHWPNDTCRRTCFKNPDGPEAATALTTLQARLDQVTEALEWWERQATAWVGTRAPTAIPGWIQPAIDKGRAALATEEKGL